jgi:hypothetical protein
MAEDKYAHIWNQIAYATESLIKNYDTDKYGTLEFLGLLYRRHLPPWHNTPSIRTVYSP